MAVDDISAAPKAALNMEPSVEKPDLAPGAEVSDSESLQAGVRRADMLQKGWTRQGLIITFAGHASLMNAFFVNC